MSRFNEGQCKITLYMRSPRHLPASVESTHLQTPSTRWRSASNVRDESNASSTTSGSHIASVLTRATDRENRYHQTHTRFLLGRRSPLSSSHDVQRSSPYSAPFETTTLTASA